MQSIKEQNESVRDVLMEIKDYQELNKLIAQRLNRVI